MITNNIASVAGGSCEQPILGGGGTIVFHRDLRGNSRVGKPRVKFPSAAHQSPHPLYQPPVHSGMLAPPTATPSQQEPSSEQTVEGEISQVAAARFEMVLNQIDLAKARVRHEKEQMKEFQKEVVRTTAIDTEMIHQQSTEEPNALTDEGQSMPEYDEKPPGDDDTGTVH